MNKEDLYSLLQRYQDNSASPEEVRLVRSWMLLTETNEDNIQQEELTAAKENIWQKLIQNNGVAEEENNVKVIRFKFLRYAAAALVIASLGVLGYLFRYPILDIVDPIASTTIETGEFEIRQVLLPDSSVITLAEKSKLIFPTKFRGDSRPVEMTGKAFFKIRRNPDMPFKVFSENVDIKVLGTSFEVNNAEHSDTATVTVVTGKVNVSNHDHLSTIALPKQQVLLFKKTSQLRLQQIGDTEQYTQWLDHKLHFEEASLAQVLNKLAEIYNVHIRFDQKEVRPSDTFSGIFKNDESLDDVLNIVCMSTGLQWKRTQNDSINISR